MKLVGAKLAPQVKGVEELPGKSCGAPCQADFLTLGFVTGWNQNTSERPGRAFTKPFTASLGARQTQLREDLK